VSRFVLSFLTIAAIAFSALAEEQPLFHIERIEVRNTHRVSADLIKSESLLHEGSEYSEQELSAAAARLTRLPFLLSTEFKLEKGSSRGQYVLAIVVNETKPFFYLIDARPNYWNDAAHTSEDDVDPALESKDATLGFRWFVGGRGVVYAGTTGRRDHDVFTSDYTALAIGYTQYDLFGTRAFASINLRRPIGSFSAPRLSPQLVVGVPLSTNQTLTLDYEDTLLQSGKAHVLGQTFDRRQTERLISLTWAYDTTNQTFVPTRGSLIRITPLRATRDRAGYTFGLTGTVPEAFTEHTSGTGVDAVAAHYWEVSDRDSLSAAVFGGWASVDENPAVFVPRVSWRPAYEVLRGGWSHDIWKGDPRSGDSRLELVGALTSRQRNVTEGDLVFGTTPDHQSSFMTSASWVRRSSWGLLRLGVGYSWPR
jgi:outer membrane protein assembly factor BamA